MSKRVLDFAWRRKPPSSKLVLALAVVPFALGLAGQLLVAVRERRMANAPVGLLDLDEGGRITPPDATVVRVTGRLQQDLVFVVENTRYGSVRSRTYYVPLTSSRWSGEAVRAVLRYELTGIATGVGFEKGLILGERTRAGVPPLAVRAWEKAGLHLSPEVVILDHRYTSDGKPAVDPGRGTWLGLLGLLLGLVFVIGAVSTNPGFLRRGRS